MSPSTIGFHAYITETTGILFMQCYVSDLQLIICRVFKIHNEDLEDAFLRFLVSGHRQAVGC